MHLPISTYRLQLHQDFDFEAVRRILSYLQELGISDIYASPILKARSGSQHGYDVVDPNQLNPELGDTESVSALIEECQEYGLGWVQDIVPNHMAYDSENEMLMDVLKNGADSEYCDYFDLTWDHPDEDLRGRVLVPMLGDFYGICLERGEIQLAYSQDGFTVNYYDLKLPLNVESYARLLTYQLEQLRARLGNSHPDLIKFLGVLYMLKNIPIESSGREREQQTQFVESLLWELYTTNPEIEAFINHSVETFNGETGQPQTFDLLDTLLDEQFFRLAFWKVGAEDLNYRRFFTINELICLRIENPTVFYQTHSLIGQLVKRGWIKGLRIDHIDGLYDPVNYLRRLQQWIGDTGTGQLEQCYVVVEKILEQSEELPQNWPIKLWV
jgi:(1->4)-alpha-D-glucan 1-alpha-D-glucosylmutase